jgi:rhodanese-related sulfurtransferase
MSNLLQEQWMEQLQNDDNAIVLDVRTDEEVAMGKIPNAINIDIYKGQGFVYEVDKLDKSKNFYVYCRSGARSAQACSFLNQLGIKNTYNLVGGIMSWTGEVEYSNQY